MIVVDTHVLMWAMEDHPRLGETAREVISIAAAGTGVHVSAITPWEIAMLVQKGRLSLGREVGAWIEAALSLSGVRLAPIDPVIAIDAVRLPGALHADPADRLIIATARHMAFPLLTADQAILTYATGGHLTVIDASR